MARCAGDCADMFDVALPELMLVAVVALLVIGPKDLPKAMRFVGHWVGKARGVARQFRTGFDSMVREAELADMEKKWAEENQRIMREHPPQAPATLFGPGTPTGDAAAAANASGPQVTASVMTDDDAPPVMVEQPVVAPASDPGLPASATELGKAPS